MAGGRAGTERVPALRRVRDLSWTGQAGLVDTAVGRASRGRPGQAARRQKSGPVAALRVAHVVHPVGQIHRPRTRSADRRGRPPPGLPGRRRTARPRRGRTRGRPGPAAPPGRRAGHGRALHVRPPRRLYTCSTWTPTRARSTRPCAGAMWTCTTPATPSTPSPPTRRTPRSSASSPANPCCASGDWPSRGTACPGVRRRPLSARTRQLHHREHRRGTHRRRPVPH